ncbi:MAG: hypothetical protein Q8Q14_12290 [Gemmatimonadales bacterium]|nr:hypothetical protein [Gemmatimonadales bacterium]
MKTRTAWKRRALNERARLERMEDVAAERDRLRDELVAARERLAEVEPALADVLRERDEREREAARFADAAREAEAARVAERERADALARDLLTARSACGDWVAEAHKANAARRTAEQERDALRARLAAAGPDTLFAARVRREAHAMVREAGAVDQFRARGGPTAPREAQRRNAALSRRVFRTLGKWARGQADKEAAERHQWLSTAVDAAKGASREYSGGHDDPARREAFSHGMQTVINVLIALRDHPDDAQAAVCVAHGREAAETAEGAQS